MPEYWYSYRAIDKDAQNAELNQKIVAAYKPYFMTYVYPTLKSRYSKYLKDTNKKVRRLFKRNNCKDVDDLMLFDNKTLEMRDFLEHFETDRKIGLNPCIVNRICWIFEKAFPKLVIPKQSKNFDYSILKCGTEYSKYDYEQIRLIYKKYLNQFDEYHKMSRLGMNDDYEFSYHDFASVFKMEASKICTNEQELCDIVLDICYQSEWSKRFAWMISGDVIVNNLLRKNFYQLTFPNHGGDEFEYCGEMFSMVTVVLEEEDKFDCFK